VRFFFYDWQFYSGFIVRHSQFLSENVRELGGNRAKRL